MSPVRAPRARVIVSVLLALAAAVFVVRVVPFRDRCVAPEAGGSAERAPVVRTERGCTLLLAAGPRTLGPAECRALKCDPGVVTTFSRARPWPLLGLFALYLGGSFLWAMRWRLLVRLGGSRMSLLRVWRVTLESQAGGVLLPGGVGGDALRVLAAVGDGVPSSVVVASVLLDRVIGLVTLAGVAAGVSLGVNGLAPGARAPTLTLGAIPVAAALGFAVVRATARSGLVQRALDAPPPRVARLAAHLRPALAYVVSKGAVPAILRALLASCAVSAIQLGVLRGALAVLGVTPTSESWVYMGSAASFMVAAIPVLPGGWGTADAAFVFFLARAGVEPQAALGASLVYRTFWYLSAIIGAGLHLARVRARPAPDAHATPGSDPRAAPRAAPRTGMSS